MPMKPCWLLVASAIASADALLLPSLHCARRSNVVMRGGLQLDDREATRDSQPDSLGAMATRDSSGPIETKQQNIYEVEPGEKFAEYLAKRRSSAATPPSVPSAPQSVPAKPLPSVSPMQGVVLGAGTLGLFGAAFCTLAGSPPGGLAIAFSALAVMAIGATKSEPKGSGARSAAVPEEGSAFISPLQAFVVVFVVGTLGVVVATVGLIEFDYTTTTDLGNVLVDKFQSIPASATEAWRSVM